VGYVIEGTNITVMDTFGTEHMIELSVFMILFPVEILQFQLQTKVLGVCMHASMSRHRPSVLCHCWLGHLTCKNPISIQQIGCKHRPLNGCDISEC